MSNKSKGGVARALALSPEKRIEISKKATDASVKKRKQYFKATHEGDLSIGNLTIKCFVLEDKRRMIAAQEIGYALGYSGRRTSKITSLYTQKSLENFFSEEMKIKLQNPVIVKTSRKTFMETLDGETFVEICDSILKSRDHGCLSRQQVNLAISADRLVRAIAKTGMVSLIDEATGYQENRAKDALSKILEGFISQELQPYVSMFPHVFFKQLFRLRGLDFLKDGVKNPRYFGHLVNNIVYKRLAPGVFDELKRKTPIGQSGYKLAKYFQSLSPEGGMKALISHLGSVIALMEISDTYDGFMKLLERVKPLQIEIPQDLIDSNLEQFEEHKSQRGI